MTRRTLLQTASAALISSHSTKSQTRRPKNVLLVMSDQHKRDCLGVAGDSVAQTPHLDALANTGVRFTNAYCSNPVCTPSRASLMTGLYTHNHQSWNNTVPLPMTRKTMAHWFGSAGYATSLIGKMHFVDAQTHGFDYKIDFNDWMQYLGPKTQLYADELGRANSGSGLPEIDDFWRDFGDPWKGHRQLDSRQGAVAVGAISKLPEQDHFDNFVARESVRFLKQYGKREEPFFLVTSFLKPHDPFMPAARFANKFRPEDMRLPSTWGKVNLAQVPAEVKRSIEQNAPTPELIDRAEAKKRIAFYYANLAQMDDCVGTVLTALKNLGLAEDTIVAYTADHGEMLGEHGMWQKFQFYEASCGVPLVIHAPGVSKPGVCPAPISQVGMAATLAELTGIQMKSRSDAPSFAEQVKQPNAPRKVPVFAEYNLRTPQAKYMLRDGDFKFSFWCNDMPELYHLRSDPGELTNLAFDPKYRDQVSAMKSHLFAWYTPPELKR